MSTISLSKEKQQSILAKVYAYMFIGLLITALTSYEVSQNMAALELTKNTFFLIVLFQLGLVVVLSFFITKIHPVMATGLFILYSISTGVVLSLILLAYTESSVTSAFVTTAGVFGLSSFYAVTTKRNLNSWGGYLFMGLIGLILSSVVNFFIGSGPMDFVISLIGVVLFIGLTAYDTQKITTNRAYAIYPVLGAFILYLDFINMFLYILRLFGSRK